MKRNILSVLLALAIPFLLCQCHKVDNSGDDNGENTEQPTEKPDGPDNPDNPDNPDTPTDPNDDTPEIPSGTPVPTENIQIKGKPRVLWVDSEANYFRFTTKANIKSYCEKIAQAGFNTVVVCVKSVEGFVLYNSEKCPHATTIAGSTQVNTSFDYLAYWIEQAHKNGMKVIVSTTLFPMGYPDRQTGPVYSDPRWAGKTAVEYTMSGLKDIKRPASGKVAAFLSPIHPEVRKYLLEMIAEIVHNYAIDGYALDYCRFCDYQSDFSDAAKAAFEQYLGTTVSNWPKCIFTYNTSGGTTNGTYFNQWNAFKAKVVHDFVEKASNTIHSIKPEVEVHYWAASWWQAINGNGQNWASPNQITAQQKWSWGGSWYSQAYAKQGFADHLDVFQLGSYLTKVYGASDAESIEYAITRGYELVGKDCKMYGTISCDSANFQLDSAIKLCLERTEGIMIFDLVYVIKHNWWDTIKTAFAKYDTVE